MSHSVGNQGYFIICILYCINTIHWQNDNLKMTSKLTALNQKYYLIFLNQPEYINLYQQNVFLWVKVKTAL